MTHRLPAFYHIFLKDLDFSTFFVSPPRFSRQAPPEPSLAPNSTLFANLEPLFTFSVTVQRLIWLS